MFAFNPAFTKTRFKQGSREPSIGKKCFERTKFSFQPDAGKINLRSIYRVNRVDRWCSFNGPGSQISSQCLLNNKQNKTEGHIPKLKLILIQYISKKVPKKLNVFLPERIIHDKRET